MALGCDAISSYATHADGSGEPYSALASHVASFWDACKATGASVVPLIMSGWDRRPRVIHPVPWETYQQPWEGIEKYYVTPTPMELAMHVQEALDWVEQHPEAAVSRTVLIYAWNENDEGGWLVPTLSEGIARINAIRTILNSR